MPATAQSARARRGQQLPNFEDISSARVAGRIRPSCSKKWPAEYCKNQQSTASIRFFRSRRPRSMLWVLQELVEEGARGLVVSILPLLRTSRPPLPLLMLLSLPLPPATLGSLCLVERPRESKGTRWRMQSYCSTSVSRPMQTLRIRIQRRKRAGAKGRERASPEAQASGAKKEGEQAVVVDEGGVLHLSWAHRTCAYLCRRLHYCNVRQRSRKLV